MGRQIGFIKRRRHFGPRGGGGMLFLLVMVFSCLLGCGTAWSAVCGNTDDPGRSISGEEAAASLSGIGLSTQERAWLRAHPVVRLTYHPEWPPIEFKDKTGKLSGITSDYIKLFEQRLGIVFEAVPSSEGLEASQCLKRGDADLCASLPETDSRYPLLSFTQSYLTVPVVVLTRDEICYVGSLNELRGKTVAVVDGDAVSEWIARDYPDIIQVKVPSVRAGLARVDEQNVFACVDNMLALSYCLAHAEYRHLKISGLTPYVYHLAIAVRKDWSTLAGILQKVLSSVSEQDRMSIYRKWVPVNFGSRGDYSLFWKISAFSFLIFVALFIWNQSLAGEIRKRRRVEATLSTLENNYRELFEEHAAVKLLIDPASGAIVDANRSACAFYGWTRDQFQRMTLRQLCESDDVFRTAMARIAQDRDLHFEMRQRLADSSFRDVELFGTRVQWKEGDFLHVIIHNVTERKAIEAEREQLMAAIEQTADGVMIADAVGTIRFVNPAFETMTGEARQALLGRNVDVLLRDARNGVFYRNLGAAVASGHLWKGRFENRQNEGTSRVVETTISPVRDKTGKIVNYVSVDRDVTEHVHMAEQLQRAQKMESVGRLAGGVAHDFNNMLQIILGHVELALDTVDADNPIVQDLQAIEQATRTSSELTRKLLTFARRQTISPQALDLNAVLTDMLEQQKKASDKDIEWVWHPKKELWPVMMDVAQVKQIFDNLCQNAQESITGPGQITVSTDTTVLDADYCQKHAGVACGAYVVLSIRDSGRGIMPEMMEYLFEPFFTTKKMGKGAGLGLATVYGIVKQNNGTIDVASEPGKGTVFTVYLPRHAGEVAAVPSSCDNQPPKGHGETLLVVEDEAVILAMVRRNLERLGYRVFTAALPHLALELAEAHAHEICLLVTDVVMPEMNGKELSKKLLARNPSLKVLFMSGYTADAIAHHGMLEEGVCFLQKPFTTLDLAQKVREVLDRT